MSKTKAIIKKKPFQGSIRAEDRELFHKRTTTKIASWSYEGLHGTFSERCLTTRLIELFQRLKVAYLVDDNPEPGTILIDKIPGVEILYIEQDGKAHVRIRFEGDTESHFNLRRDKIQSYLNKNNIPSEEYCLFICPVGIKQKELTDKYLLALEDANK